MRRMSPHMGAKGLKGRKGRKRSASIGRHFRSLACDGTCAPGGLTAWAWGLFGPLGEAGAGHTFAQPALLKESSFQTAELSIEQVSCDFDLGPLVAGAGSWGYVPGYSPNRSRNARRGYFRSPSSHRTPLYGPDTIGWSSSITGPAGLAASPTKARRGSRALCQ